MKKKYCVVVPTYKKYKDLSDDELICLKSIYDNYPKDAIYFLIPDSLDMSGYFYTDDDHLYRNDDMYFNDTKTYSQLCLSTFFYEYFKEYEYMLIHQLDAYTIINNIDYFINMGYDFYGAPIYRNKNNRNGGFCLRNIDKMIEFCNTHIWDGTPEDFFICVVCKENNNMNICPIDICWKFSIQGWIPKDVENNLPMGCHQLNKNHPKLWEKIINLNKK